MSLMIMRHSIPEAFRGTESEEITQAKGFLDEIEKRFAKNDKVEMTSLLTSLMSMKYKGQGNVREYITEMFHITSKLKALKIEFSEELLVLMVLPPPRSPLLSPLHPISTTLRHCIGNVLHDDCGAALLVFFKLVSSNSATETEILAKEATLVFKASKWVSFTRLITGSDCLSSFRLD
ncbi:hypothetical protein PVK06_040374 [Gossypium arboreum]|uniref:Uncharacterized protein n=1 Tax=Gossypium arboreum TaxID=29729 RepID=A0ABR0N7F5_GOSAR|nr:hypothetical protein PVK06_040374 [Gossypium arboreum]